MKHTTVYDCSVLELPKINNRAGNITPITGLENIPFEIKRVYYLYDEPGGEDLGGHAHKELQQFIIAANGWFDGIIDNGCRYSETKKELQHVAPTKIIFSHLNEVFKN